MTLTLPSIRWFRLFATIALSTFLLGVAVTPAQAQHSDVLLQTLNGKAVTGAADYDNNTWTLGAQVYRRNFLSNFRSADPGFTGFAYGNANMPAGAGSFPSSYNVSFDLLPMSIGQVSSNLFYWNGADLGGDGLDMTDVRFIRPTGVAWEIFDANFNLFSATGTDQLVPGGLIQRTSSDIDPFDGVDSGAIHKHLVLQLDDNDGNSGTSPAQGIYMIAWQARAVGFETSDPFLFVHRTSTISDAANNLAADWAIANLEMLTSPVLRGDYDADGDVDGNDFLDWQRTLGSAGASLSADGSDNGVIDAADLMVWRDNFGAIDQISSASVSASSVPEPAAMLLALMAACGLAGHRARSQA